MPAMKFRTKDLSAGGFTLNGVHTVRNPRFAENDYKGKSDRPDVALFFDAENEHGEVREIAIKVGPTIDKKGRNIYSIVNDGKSVDGPAPFKDGEFGILLASLEEAGFDMDSFESSQTDDNGDAYMDITAIDGLCARWGAVKGKEYTKGDGTKVTPEFNKVLEILGGETAAKKPAPKAAGKATKADKPAKASVNIEELAIAEVKKALAAAGKPVGRGFLPSRVQAALDPKGKHNDAIVELVSDYEWQDKLGDGAWEIIQDKLVLADEE